MSPCSVVLKNMTKHEIDAKLADLKAKSADKLVQSLNNFVSVSATGKCLEWIDCNDAMKIKVTGAYGDNIYNISRTTIQLLMPSFGKLRVYGATAFQDGPPTESALVRNNAAITASDQSWIHHGDTMTIQVFDQQSDATSTFLVSRAMIMSLLQLFGNAFTHSACSKNTATESRCIDAAAASQSCEIDKATIVKLDDLESSAEDSDDDCDGSGYIAEVCIHAIKFHSFNVFTFSYEILF